jgi:predicted glycoside hydrolase/deacetylase ChbG (UPF0249 family)
MLLIVNADDFGLTLGVSAGILRAHRDGIVTSTSVLAVGRAFDATSAALRDAGMGVGVHLTLVGEDPPLLGAREIPTLVGARGRFRRSWREYAGATLGGRVDVADVHRELRAQLEKVQRSGLTITHLDTHQHLHLLGPVASVLFDLGARAGVSALRVPARPGSGPTDLLLGRLTSRLRNRAASLGFRSPEAFAGLGHSGHMSQARLEQAIGQLADSAVRSAELGVHPGEGSDPDRARFRWGFEWGAELAGLCAPSVRRVVERCGVRLGTFADLPAEPPRSTHREGGGRPGCLETPTSTHVKRLAEDERGHQHE